MKTYKSAKQKETELIEQNKKLLIEIDRLKEALQRIANTYDHIEDFAGLVSSQALKEQIISAKQR